MTDSSGNELGTIKYFPFGATRSGSVPTDKQFTGQRLDTTGLYYYNARYYDPEIGRFISPDTIVPDYTNPQSFNRYSYCLNNPLKYIDPTGYQYDEYWYYYWLYEYEKMGGDISEIPDYYYQPGWEPGGVYNNASILFAEYKNAGGEASWSEFKEVFEESGFQDIYVFWDGDIPAFSLPSWGIVEGDYLYFFDWDFIYDRATDTNKTVPVLYKMLTWEAEVDWIRGVVADALYVTADALGFWGSGITQIPPQDMLMAAWLAKIPGAALPVAITLSVYAGAVYLPDLFRDWADWIDPY